MSDIRVDNPMRSVQPEPEPEPVPVVAARAKPPLARGRAPNPLNAGDMNREGGGGAFSGSAEIKAEIRPGVAYTDTVEDDKYCIPCTTSLSKAFHFVPCCWPLIPFCIPLGCVLVSGKVASNPWRVALVHAFPAWSVLTDCLCLQRRRSRSCSSSASTTKLCAPPACTGSTHAASAARRSRRSGRGALCSHSWLTFASLFAHFCLCSLTFASLSVQNMDVGGVSNPIKIADGDGNPVIVSGVVGYRVINSKAAALEVEDARSYVHTQAQTTLKQVVSRYPYETNDGSASLKSETYEIGIELCQALQEKATVAGILIESFELADLSYAPEIARGDACQTAG